MAMQLIDRDPAETPVPLLLEVSSITLRLTREEFDLLCRDHPEGVFELTRDGELLIMSPADGESSNYEVELGTDLAIWNRQTKLGKTFAWCNASAAKRRAIASASSSGGFVLSNWI
jgi:Uma2 family endonuclease